MADRDVIAGRYRLDAEIGSGGMGEVWRATDRETGATVALKRVRLSHLAAGERDRARERLRAEAGIASRLRHPHIIAVHGLVEHDGEPWLVMEYVPAPNLADLTADGPLPPPRVAGIGAQVAEALAYAHGSTPGVLHRDVTPRNLLVGNDDHGDDHGDDQVTLTDFGISKVEGEDTIGTGGLPFAGVAAYVAPEVANGVKGGPKADVFVPGLETADPDRGFAGWECSWDTPSGEAAIDVRYDHNAGLDEDMGAPTRIVGRDAAVEPEGDGLECDVTILHRTYIDQFGNPYSELLDLEVRQPELVADPCPQAVAVATVAVERLPAAP